MEQLIPSLPNHIASRINICKTSGCWIYEGKDPSSNGYQRAWYKGVRSATHRIVYVILMSVNIEKRELDHECCNRACCNPEHLTPMSHKKNCKLRDMRNK